jgi:hypothetical protein
MRLLLDNNPTPNLARALQDAARSQIVRGTTRSHRTRMTSSGTRHSPAIGPPLVADMGSKSNRRRPVLVVAVVTDAPARTTGPVARIPPTHPVPTSSV